MKEYEIGLIFVDDKDYTNKANWCNENGYYIDEIDPKEDGTRQFKICAPKEKTLAELKQNKLSELTSITSRFDNQLVNNDMFIISSLGFKINADLRSQNNIRGLISVNADTVNFVDYNNEVHELTPSDLNTLLIECTKNGENLYKQKWAYAAKIKSCETVEELDRIAFNFTMLDFSNE